MYADEVLAPRNRALLAELGLPAPYDCHTHVGERDPSGFTATLDELLEGLAMTGGRAVVTPLAEPDGYDVANKECADAAAASGGVLTALTRVTPEGDPGAAVRRGLDAGARGVKLHPSSDEFELADPRLEPVWRLAEEHRLPLLVHAGPELEDVGRTAVQVCRDHPDLRLILAHCALCDLGWIWKEVASTPHLFFDTSWWAPAQLLALFRLVPPGRILLASDVPYSTPVSSTLTTVRCAWQAGLDDTQLRSVAGGQLERLLASEEPLPDGVPPTHERRLPGPLLEILSSSLLAALEPMQRGEEPGVPLTLARRGCDVAADSPDADVVAAVARLLDLYDAWHERLPRRNQFTPGWDLIAAAAIVARTPAAPLPETD